MAVSVLLMESSDELAEGVRDALANSWLAWDVHRVASLAHARDALAQRPFDVALVCCRLADGAAYDALKELRSMPALILVPAGLEAQAAHALRHGFSDFVVQDAAGQYLLSLPAQVEAVLERAQAAQSRKTAEQLLARQHRLLQAIFRAQASFIDSAPARQTFEPLLHELLALTESAWGFLGQVESTASGTRLLRIHAISDIAWDAASRAQWAQLDAGGLVFDNPATLIGQALQGSAPLISNHPAEDPRAGGLPPGHPPLHSFMAVPIAAAGQIVAMVGIANRAGGYTTGEVSFLQPLLHTVGHLELARRSDAQRRSMEQELARTSEALSEKTRVLEVTLASVSQGISNVDADGYIRAYNQRYLELLDLPAALLERQPHMSEVVRFQTERGDFGPDFSNIDAAARRYVASESVAQARLGDMPAYYLRKTAQGRYLEVRTRLLPGGGRVRTFADVTDYLAAQLALARSEARWRSLTQLSSDWYWEQDAQDRLVRLEGNLRADGGFSEQQLRGQSLWELADGPVDGAKMAEHRARIAGREVFHDFEVLRTAPTGEPRWLTLSGEPMFDEEGVYTGYRGVARDITERKRAEAEIERLAFYDDLTGLPNRRLLVDRLHQAMAQCARFHTHGALLFLDLDNFKDINDTLGHEWGDRLLCEVGQRLSEGLRATDTVARLGGDEFIVVLHGLAGSPMQAAQEVETVALKILARLNQAFEIEGRSMHSTPSIGITLFDGAACGSPELLKRADIAMYEAKAQGRNTVCFFDPQMQAAASARSLLEADIRQALARSEFFVHYQRVVDPNGRLLGAEALVRWQHPQRGLVMPGAFIGVVEQTGLILPLGQIVLRSACEQLAAWSLQGASEGLTISVNVSAQEFRHPQFVDQTLAIVEETGVNPALLKLELTESLLLHDVEDCIAKMQVLRSRGLGFSLDDFGTGYSSLAYLKRLPLDQLKIDQSFVRDVLTDPNDAAIACTIIALAQSLGLDVVAEGVETDGQRQFLLSNGCRRFQGYLFGRPGPADALFTD
jgi:diguanylate cyclase (GGDEF)-like protein/PAS domain S-box-containing protein